MLLTVLHGNLKNEPDTKTEKTIYYLHSFHNSSTEPNSKQHSLEST